MQEEINYLKEVVSQLLPLVQAHNEYLNKGIQKEDRKKSFTKSYNGLSDDEKNTYNDAMQSLYNKNKQGYLDKGYDDNPEFFDEDFSTGIEAIIDDAIAKGANPAKTIYQLAIQQGYTPQQAEQITEEAIENTEEQEVEQEVDNPELTAVDIVERSTVPSSGGKGKVSGYSQDQLVDMMNNDPVKYFKYINKGIK